MDHQEQIKSSPSGISNAILMEIESVATSMAREAGRLLGKYFGNYDSLCITYKDKNKRDPVTNVDTECQEFLSKIIRDKYPSHGILGEEDITGDAPESFAPDFVWVLDPLDGTKNFVGGLPVYACSIGVLHKGSPVVGAIYIPWPSDNGGVVIHGHKNGGAFFEGAPISVFKSDKPEANRLAATPAYFDKLYEFQKPMLGRSGDLRITGSIAYEMALTAAGVFQYSIITGPRLWDAAGGVTLVREAGGLVLHPKSRASLFGNLAPGVLWEPLESFLPTFQSGVTTMKELRNWVEPLAVGSHEIVDYVTSNIRYRQPLFGRLKGRMRNLQAKRIVEKH